MAIIAVKQECDWCGIEGEAPSMMMPVGWVAADMRAGQDPGVVGFGWNVCSAKCLLEVVEDWGKGLNPAPLSVSRHTQPDHGHSHEEPEFRPIAADDSAYAPTSHEFTEHRVVQPSRPPCGCGQKTSNRPYAPAREVPLHMQGQGGH